MLITKTIFSVQHGEFIDKEVTLVQEYDTVYEPGNWQVVKNGMFQNVARYTVKNNTLTY